MGVGSGAPRGKRDRSEAEAFSRTCWWPDRDPVLDSPPACRWHLSSHGGGTRGETSDGAVLPQGLAGNAAGLRGRAGSRPVMPGGAWTSPDATAPGPLSRDHRSPRASGPPSRLPSPAAPRTPEYASRASCFLSPFVFSVVKPARATLAHTPYRIRTRKVLPLVGGSRGPES